MLMELAIGAGIAGLGAGWAWWQVRRRSVDRWLTRYVRERQRRWDPHPQEEMYAFIHGNWALDNSRPDGRWCGINNELDVLRETGCFADFTLPSAPSPCQTSTINRIYYAVDDPKRPKSHDTGFPIAEHRTPER